VPERNDRAREISAATGVRKVSALATAGMLLLSWPLWAGESEIPRVPFVPWLREWPGALTWAEFAALLAAVVLTTLARVWRRWFAISLLLIVTLVLGDQHRLQPWIYQYAMTCLLLASLPESEGLRYVRWWFVGIYLHSGLSKLDVSFRDELGADFLRAAAAPLGLNPGNWSQSWQGLAALAMPAAEALVAAVLALPRLRRLGCLGAVALHLTLLFILGPAGLGHSTIVLVWNLAMLFQVWLAFWWGSNTVQDFKEGRDLKGRFSAGGPLSSLVRLAFLVGVLMPFGERWELCDAWPAHALYASHVGRVTVWLPASMFDAVSPSLRRHLMVVPGIEEWRRLDLTGWSRELRGTPVYPQRRACLGLSEGLAARYGARGPMRVVISGPAAMLTGRRTWEEVSGVEAIRKRGERFWINAHPSAPYARVSSSQESSRTVFH
jgi:hypothetical protein